MPACEKCWRDAGGNPEHYQCLLDVRKGDKKCTPEQQAGFAAGVCPKCNRKTVHQYSKVCMVLECDYKEPTA